MQQQEKEIAFNRGCVDCGNVSDDIYAENGLGGTHGPLCLACADKYPVADEEEG